MTAKCTASAGLIGCGFFRSDRTPRSRGSLGSVDMLLAGRFRRMSMWLWSSPPDGRLLVIVRRDRPALVERMQRLFAREGGEVEVVLDRRRRERRASTVARQPDRRRA